MPLVAEGLADIDEVLARAVRAWQPPPRLSLSEWADEHFVLSAETAAEPGRWRTLPYQRGIMDAITDPTVYQVSLMKSARVGYTLMLSAALGYYMHQDPSSILVVQPTVDDAKNFSKETIAPMLRDVPVLAGIVFKDIEEKGSRDSSNTLTHKAFPGGVLSLTGANSGTGFRRISRRVVARDEVDAYPVSAGSEGDPIELSNKRAQAFWNRKLLNGSTPLLAGSSRIEELFEAGDRRRYYVPCPVCGHFDFLAFSEREDGRGHWMAWPDGRPQDAHFVCSGNGCVIEHRHKRTMIERGEWRAEGEFEGHASFHIWAAYSYSPNSTWADIAKEFLTASKAGPEKLKTFVNTMLGETWKERGEAPEWLRMYQRREHYALGTVPAGALFLTAGVDVQKDRLVWEVVGWGADRQSWSVDAGVFPGDTSDESPAGPWARLDELLARAWPGAEGSQPIRVLAVDSGYNTQTVYNWARRYPRNRVIAVKGAPGARALLGAPSTVDVNVHGKRMARGYKVWPVGVDVAKSEFYGWLGLEPPTTESGLPHPPGYCHFPQHGEDFFKQITAEHLVQIRKRTGVVRHEWQVQPGRENHWLDCRVYARAAAALVGLDRMARRPAPPRQAVVVHAAAPAAEPPAQASPPAVAPLVPTAPVPVKQAPPAQPAPAPAPARQPRQRQQTGGWLGGGRGLSGRRGNWLGRR